MSEPTALFAPAQADPQRTRQIGQALAAVPPEQLLARLRQRRAVALVPTVRALVGGYRVGTIGKDSEYLYEGADGDLECSCKDYQRFELEPGYACLHMMAVSMAKHQASLCMDRSADSQDGRGRHELTVVHRYETDDTPVHVRLIKDTTGYSWEFAVDGRDPATVLALLQELQQKVRTEFDQGSHE
jgi:hypothetical protein